MGLLEQLETALREPGNLSLWFGIVSAIAGILVFDLYKRYFGNSEVEGAEISRGLLREQALSSKQNSANDDRVLNPIHFKPFTVISTNHVSHNTTLIRFEIPSGRDLGLSVGRHVSVMAHINGQKVIRPYTPTSSPDTKGYFELMVKKYQDGKMSSHIWDLTEGSSLDFRGPVGRFKYEKNQYKKIGLIAGGTGLTPCLQVIRCILEGPEGEGDNTQFVLFFQNRTEADILLKEELSALADMYPDRLRVLFFLSNPSESSWGQEFDTSRALKAYFNKPSKGSIPQVKGYISKEAVKAAMSFRDCPLVGICGPSGFNESMKQLLLNEGHDDQSIYIW